MLRQRDRLGRPTQADRGTLDDPPSEGLLAGSTGFRQGWELDQVGNWEKFRPDQHRTKIAQRH